MPDTFDPAAARPQDLPRPACKVVVVAGPPGAGKTTYAKKHMQPGDLLIDFEVIGEELGFDRLQSRDHVGDILAERNRRLRALATAQPDLTAYVCLLAPSPTLRHWWREILGAEKVVVLDPGLPTVHRQIRRDRSRRAMVRFMLRLVDEWYDKERRDDPGYVVPGVDADGQPTDRLHPWRR